MVGTPIGTVPTNEPRLPRAVDARRDQRARHALEHRRARRRREPGFVETLVRIRDDSRQIVCLLERRPRPVERHPDAAAAADVARGFFDGEAGVGEFQVRLVPGMHGDDGGFRVRDHRRRVTPRRRSRSGASSSRRFRRPGLESRRGRRRGFEGGRRRRRGCGRVREPRLAAGGFRAVGCGGSSGGGVVRVVFIVRRCSSGVLEVGGSNAVVVVVVVVCHVAGHDGLRALLRRDGCVPHVRLCQRLVRGSRGGDDGGDGRIEVLFLVVRGRIFFRVFRWVRGCRRRDVRQLVGKRHRFLARVFLHGAHPRVPAEDDAAVEPVLEVQPVAALDVEGEVPCGLASHDGTLELEPAEVAVLDVQHGVLGVELGERADPALLDVRELPWEYRHVPGFLDARSLVDVLAVAPAEELGGHELPDGRGPDARELPAVHGGVEDLAASLGLTLFLDGERVSLLVSGGSLLRRHPRSRPRRHATPPTRSRHDDR
mmetsp:Transcript_13610/g.55083  ORF Transcript_13610/g.55083 Transcript_13610/m.55083 type:complete len:485 (-) Transcript_13610:81-1535(-)